MFGRSAFCVIVIVPTLFELIGRRGDEGFGDGNVRIVCRRSALAR
jgi:4-hydroxyphenylpyruvate dioxygenase-like putative hemolysin